MIHLETLAIATPIALLYPTFVHYFSNYYTKNEELKNECIKNDFLHATTMTKDEIDSCKKRRKDAATIKFIMMLIAGVLGIGGCAFTNTFGIALGLAIGAIICLTLSVFTYWEYSDDGIRTIASGVALVAVVLISHQMYDSNSKLSKKIKSLRQINDDDT
jgi:hypothetical protein